MRLKKPCTRGNQDITFDTIEKRNKAINTLVDGDLVKVLDASKDPNISRGWAIYRFTFETQTFDLIEKQEKDKIPTPDTNILAHDDLTIVKNQEDKLTSFHDLNHGVHFKFPNQIQMNFEADRNGEVRIIWSGNKDNIDTWSATGMEFKLKLQNISISPYSLAKNFDDYGKTHYMVIKACMSSSYRPSSYDYQTDFPDIGIISGGREKYLTIAVVKFVFDDYKILDTKKTQVSHIYKHGQSLHIPTPYTPTKPKTYEEITSRDAAAGNDEIEIGETVQVLDASRDFEVESGWAWYRMATDGGFDLISKQPIKPEVQEPYTPPTPKTFSNIFTRDVSTKKIRYGEIFKVLNASDDPEVSSGWAWYRKVSKGIFELISKEVVSKDPEPSIRVYPDNYSIEEYDINNGERPTFAVIDAMKSFRHDQILLADFDYKVEYVDYTDSFLFKPNKQRKIPIMIGDTRKYLVVAAGGVKRHHLPSDATKAYFTIEASIVDTIDDPKNTIGILYGTTCDQVRPYPKDSNYSIKLFQVRVDIPPLGGTIDTEKIYMCKYWKHALAPFDDLMDYRIANP